MYGTLIGGREDDRGGEDGGEGVVVDDEGKGSIEPTDQSQRTRKMQKKREVHTVDFEFKSSWKQSSGQPAADEAKR